MPVYEYKCTVCAEHFDVEQSFTEDSLTTLDGCEIDTLGQHQLKKVFSAVGISFKGDGFYKNDSRPASSSSKSTSDSEKSDSSTSSSDSTTSSSDSSSSDSSSTSDSSDSKTSSTTSSSTSDSGSTATKTTTGAKSS